MICETETCHEGVVPGRKEREGGAGDARMSYSCFRGMVFLLVGSVHATSTEPFIHARAPRHFLHSVRISSR